MEYSIQGAIYLLLISAIMIEMGIITMMVVWMNQKDYSKNISLIWDWIDEQRALMALMPGYINDPADVDRENCFV